MPALAAASSGNSGSSNGTFILIGVVILLGVLLFVSNRRKRRQAQQQQESLKIGTPVSTTSGLLGTLSALDERTATVEVSPGVHLQFVRRAVVPRSALLPDAPAADAPDAGASSETGVFEDAGEPAAADQALRTKDDRPTGAAPDRSPDDHDDTRAEA
ncbi:preprotein translocase subunit YajC [Allobranchiibius sp. GilTou73]|uniref:preprotein translocase subunit YajC n=1 Tax=Allobranchiibius sp. GilTou73 TaxID=2904523 RepID=UPI001F47AC15|nr:preprotein translocase subunit YajC [Allobranchiibius sp. GilTou73]UIJ34079.1 preprotein translocase subunit YajC [Allobranchiibius sp. GilTou73]